MPTVTVEKGATLHYRDVGSGDPPVVLLHGFPFSSALWDPQLVALSNDYRIISPDLRGFGRSPASAQPYSIAQLADDTASLLDQLGLERAVIAGLSMGGYVAFEFFRRHPHRVTALILADTRPDPDSREARDGRAKMAQSARDAGSAAVTQQLMPKLLASGTSANKPQVAEELRKMMETQDPEAIAAALMAMAERADSRPLLRTIDVPVLVLGGSEDAITPATDTREWANAIAGARVEFIEQAGHVSNLEQPEAFNKLLLDFLSALPGETTPAGRK